MKRLRSEVTLPDSLDNAFIDKYAASNEVLFTLGGQKYPLSLLIGEFGRRDVWQARWHINLWMPNLQRLRKNGA